VVRLISEKLSGIYTKLEDKYFDVLDFLDHKGLPVYTYSDFFEEKGVPSFIVTIAIIFMLFLLVGLVITGPALGSGEILITLQDNVSGQSLNNVNLKIFDSEHNLIKESTVSSGNTINIPTQKEGTKIYFEASRSGYTTTTEELMIGKERGNTKIYLDKQFNGINAKLRLTDVEKTYFVSACYMHELSHNEIVSFTNAMVDTGKTLNFGDKIVVGAHYDNDNGFDSGSAYVLNKPSSGWVNATEKLQN